LNLLNKTTYPYRGLPKEIYVLFVSRIINSMGAFVFPLLALILTQKIGLTKVQAGSFVTLLALSQVPGMLIGGKLVDSFGRKKIIIIFQVLGASCYLFCGLLNPSKLMALFIVFASSFYGMAGPAFDAVSADLTLPSNRKGAYSLLYMGHNIGFSVAPIIGGILYKHHLPLLFIGDGITTLLSLALFTIFIKETLKEKDAVIENSNKLEAHEEGSVFTVLFKRPILLYFALIMFIYQFTYSQWGFTLPLQMGDVFGSNGAQLFGLVAGFNGIFVILFTPMITLIIHKIKPMNAIAFGGLLYAFAFGLLGFINHFIFYFLFIFILTIGEIIISVNSNTFIANHTPASHRGRVNSILPIIIGSGYALGPMVMGPIMENYGHGITWGIISFLILFGAICMLLLEVKEKKSQLIDVNL
jgi:MFS family permease